MNTSFKRSCAGIVALALLVGAGCTSTLVSFPTAPVPNYDVSRPRTIISEASGFQLLLFIPIGVNGRYEEAWDDLQLQAAGDYIGDIMVQDSWTYAFVGTIYRVRLQANAYPIIRP